MTDREYVISFLHWDGENHDKLTPEECWQVFCAGDGFGDRTSEELKNINSGYDWSHIRDSSDEAFARMARMIRGLLVKGRAKVCPAKEEVQQHKARHCYVVSSPSAFKGVRFTYH